MKEKKIKWPRNCYYCKHCSKCKERYKVTVCDKFEFCSTCKSI